jgi:hypothetical protein
MGQLAIFLTGLIFVIALAGVSLRLYLLSRSILAILREVAPAKEKELTTNTGINLIDGVMWVQPHKFSAFVRAGDCLGNEQLALTLAQYKQTQRFAVRVGIVYLSLIAAVVLISFSGIGDDHGAGDFEVRLSGCGFSNPRLS